MKKIILCCMAGMSTSMLVAKMQRAANEANIECEIYAVAADQLKSNLDGANAVLLGPQISYKLPEIKQLCNKVNVPCDVINMLDYGSMNGARVLNFAMKMFLEPAD
ncbi:PTS sugar transporter subunit IIB [Mangrovibacter phragmitis]|uniref:PTS sugar transporter subunit IIB n=1 Tax=Mangrovibacter phragmitis TaxID=1691903 RepID=A0A1B7L6F8_9ENTR|nr:PTS sugar transporter subunit IIB [Mangrovibacter phragmitis]OAT77947.1 PTS sugar transporter subunit IIB [Mangrovibacter phragmitis]